MYKQDIKDIKDFIDKDPEQAIYGVVLFVLCTIRTPFSRVLTQIQDLNILKLNSVYCHTSRKAWLCDHSVTQDILKAYLEKDVVETMLQCVKVYGLGLPKAGFVCQLLGYNVGCLDSHNLKRFGVSVNETYLKADKKKSVQNYISLCKTLGGAEYLWDSWCEYVAGTKFNKTLPTPESVSNFHYNCILEAA